MAFTRDENNQSNISRCGRSTPGWKTRIISTGHHGPVTALAWQPGGHAIAFGRRQFRPPLGRAVGANRAARLSTASTPSPDSCSAQTGITWRPQDLSRRPNCGTSRGARPPLKLRGGPRFLSTVAGSAWTDVGSLRRPRRFSRPRIEASKTGNIFDAPDATPSAGGVWDADSGKLAGPPRVRRAAATRSASLPRKTTT